MSRKATVVCHTNSIVHGMVCRIFRNLLLKSRLTSPNKPKLKQGVMDANAGLRYLPPALAFFSLRMISMAFSLSAARASLNGKSG